MNRLLCGRSSDSDGRSLHTAGPGQLAGPRHSNAPLGQMVRGEGRGPGAVGPICSRTMSKHMQVEGRDLRRTGPSRATIQDVPLGVGNAPSDGNGTNEIALIPSRYSPLSRIVRDFRPNLWRLHLKHTLALAALQRPFQRAHGLMPPSFQSPPWPAPPSGGPAAGRCVHARRDGAAAGHVAAASDRLSEA